jgi:hypothetical protein
LKSPNFNLVEMDLEEIDAPPLVSMQMNSLNNSVAVPDADCNMARILSYMSDISSTYRGNDKTVITTFDMISACATSSELMPGFENIVDTPSMAKRTNSSLESDLMYLVMYLVMKNIDDAVLAGGIHIIGGAVMNTLPIPIATAGWFTLLFMSLELELGTMFDVMSLKFEIEFALPA